MCGTDGNPLSQPGQDPAMRRSASRLICRRSSAVSRGARAATTGLSCTISSLPALRPGLVSLVVEPIKRNLQSRQGQIPRRQPAGLQRLAVQPGRPGRSRTWFRVSAPVRPSGFSGRAVDLCLIQINASEWELNAHLRLSISVRGAPSLRFDRRHSQVQMM